MKKITFLALFISFSLWMTAQEEIASKPFVVGGSFNIVFKKNMSSLPNLVIIDGFFDEGASDYRSLAVTPTFGKVVNDNWTIGLMLSYSNSTLSRSITTFDGFKKNSDITTNSENIGMYINYTVNPQNRLSFYFQPEVSYMTSTLEENTSGFKKDTGAVDIGVGIGVHYEFNDSWRALLNLGGIRYTSGSWESARHGTNEKSQDFSNFGLVFSTSTIFFGLEFKF